MNNQWISVKERLPEEEDAYICTARWNSNEDYAVKLLEWSTRISPTIPDSMAQRVYENGGAFGEMWSDGLDNLEEVIAWQPLPKPYVMESEDNNVETI